MLLHAAFVSFALSLALSAPVPAKSKRPQVEPVTTTDGIAKKLQQHAGKPIAVKFWATWCDSCVEEFPAWVAVEQRFADTDVVFYTVSVDLRQGIEKYVKPFLRKQNDTSIALLLDAEDPAPVMKTMDPTWDGTLPATFVFDRQGARRASYIGPADALPSLLEQLVAEPPQNPSATPSPRGSDAPMR